MLSFVPGDSGVGWREPQVVIRPEITETAGVLISYRNYAGFRWVWHKSNRAYDVSHCTLDTYFRALCERILQQMVGQLSLMLQKEVGSEVTRKWWKSSQSPSCPLCVTN